MLSVQRIPDIDVPDTAIVWVGFVCLALQHLDSGYLTHHLLS